MKTSKTVIESTFKPFTISFTIESKEECELLYTLFGYNVSIPKMIREEEKLSPQNEMKLQEFMTEIVTHLRS